MKKIPEVLAKVLRTIIPDATHRKRLLDMLDRYRTRPIIWVSGPPGYGKPTLIGSFSEIKNSLVYGTICTQTIPIRPPLSITWDWPPSR